MCYLLTVFQAIVTVAAIAIAAWSAWEAKRAADASKASIEAQIVHSAMSEYFEQTMVSNIRVLRNWRDKYGDDFAAKWCEEYRNGSQEAKEVEAARRQVKGYFVKAARLHSNNLISDAALKAVAYVQGINVYYDIVCPLGLSSNPDASTSTERHLLRTIGRYKHDRPAF